MRNKNPLLGKDEVKNESESENVTFVSGFSVSSFWSLPSLSANRLSVFIARIRYLFSYCEIYEFEHLLLKDDDVLGFQVSV